MRRRQSAGRGAAAGPPLNVPRAGGQTAGSLQWLAPGQIRSVALSPLRRRLRRILRRIRRGLAVVLALGVLGAMVFGGLLLITPSVADAPSLARALDSTHGVPYPGPAVPERFAAALAAAESQAHPPGGGPSTISVAGVVSDRLTGLARRGTTAPSRDLAQILYAPGRSGMLARAEVDLLAIKLDLSYPAPRILQMYADVAYFGHGWYGLNAASCGYFGTPPARLSWAQAAMLASVVSALASHPSSRFPQAPVVAARVLTRLAAMGRLTRAQADQAGRQVLRLVLLRAARGRTPVCA